MNTKQVRHLLAWGCAAALALVTAGAHAAHPLITEDTGTQGLGLRQLEIFGDESKDGAGRRQEVYTGVLSYGLAETADLQLGLPWYRNGGDGIGDVAFDLKWRFFERDALSFALKPGVTLPTGDEGDGRGTGKMTWGSLLIVSYAPGAIALHAHLGFRRNDNKLGERESLRQLAAAATYRVGDVRFVGELTRETNPVQGGRTVRYATVGAIWSMTRDVDFDIGWRQGYGGAPIDEALLLGATVRW
ncbi:MAG: transporter [Betaproteobacteria bacterium]|nr:transporter [Betaproteobacteria bacterium]